MDIYTGLTLGVFGLILIFAFWILLKAKKSKITSKDQVFIIKSWQKILSQLSSDPHHSILNADKLLDFILKKLGYQGHLGEKLKKSGLLFSDLNGVWSAHKLRNKIAHELDINVSEREAKSALSSFRRAFRDLGVKGL